MFSAAPIGLVEDTEIWVETSWHGKDIPVDQVHVYPHYTVCSTSKGGQPWGGI